MEDFLSILIVILLAVFSAGRKNKKKKAKASAGKGPSKTSDVSVKGLAEAREFLKDVGKAILEMEDEDEHASPAKIKPARMKAKTRGKAEGSHEPSGFAGKLPPRSGEGAGAMPVSTQGLSLFDDKGCIGGSIEHDSHEGDSRYPYDTRDYRTQSDASVWAGDIAQELQSMNVQRLRRAIVISEILDRPKALRRRS